MSILNKLPIDLILNVADYLPIESVNSIILTGHRRSVNILQPYLIVRIRHGWERLGALFYAASSGDQWLTSLLLQKSQDITIAQEAVQDAEEETIVTYQSLGQPIFRFLLENGELKFYDRASEAAALHWAIRNSDYRTVRGIFKAFKCTCGIYEKCMLHVGGTLDQEAPAKLQFPPPHLHPCVSGDMKMFELILSFAPFGFGQGFSDTDGLKDVVTGRSVLHLACLNGNAQIVKYLLDNVAVDQWLQDKSGVIAVDYAIKHKHREAIYEFIRNLESGNQRWHQVHDSRGRTSLMLAAAHNFDAIAQQQIKGPSKDNLDGTDSMWMTALHYAAAAGNLMITNMLLEAGAYVAPLDHAERTPLHVAARGGRANVIARLLREGADEGLVDQYGMTPLHLACKNGSVMAVKTLLEARSWEYLNAVDTLGRTPLHLGARRKNSAACKLLVEKGADLGALDNKGMLPGWPIMKYDKESDFIIIL